MLFQRDDGIERLSSCFLWTEFDGDDKRQYLHQEFVYENVMLAITRGLSWSTVAQVANISKDLLPKFKGGPFNNVRFGPFLYNAYTCFSRDHRDAQKSTRSSFYVLLFIMK